MRPCLIIGVLCILNLSCSTFQNKETTDITLNTLDTTNIIKTLNDINNMSDLLLNQQLTDLTGNNQPLIETSQNERKKSLRDIALLPEKDLDSLIKISGIPECIKGKDYDEREKNYKDKIFQIIYESLPAIMFSKMIHDNKIPITDNVVRNKIINFLKINYKFDFRNYSIQVVDQNCNDYSESENKDQDEVIEGLKVLQRVYAIAPTIEAAEALLSDGLHSAQEVVAIGASEFGRRYGTKLEDCVVKKIYADANFIVCYKCN